MQRNIYSILMDEKWSLADLYDFPHAYSQAYALIYCFDSELNPKDSKRIDTALEQYPWRGGYSYVNIYTVLNNQIPEQHRPQISSIKYASPGSIDLILNPDVSIQLAKSVGILLSTATAAAKTYSYIYKELTELNKQRRKDENDNKAFSQKDLEAMMKMSDDLAKHLGFDSVAELNKRTKDPEITLKILLAHYRRLRIMADYVESGKVKLPEHLKKDD